MAKNGGAELKNILSEFSKVEKPKEHKPKPKKKPVQKKPFMKKLKEAIIPKPAHIKKKTAAPAKPVNIKKKQAPQPKLTPVKKKPIAASKKNTEEAEEIKKEEEKTRRRLEELRRKEKAAEEGELEEEQPEATEEAEEGELEEEQPEEVEEIKEGPKKPNKKGIMPELEEIEREIKQQIKQAKIKKKIQHGKTPTKDKDLVRRLKAQIKEEEDKYKKLKDTEKQRLSKIIPGGVESSINYSSAGGATLVEEEPEEVEEDELMPKSPKRLPEEQIRAAQLRAAKAKRGLKKEKESSRVPTGIKNFDKLIEGGLKRKSTNLIAGGAGAGKTIFAINFLVTGIIKYKEPGIYVTFEERKDKFYDDMLRFGWDLAKYEKQGMFAFIEYSPQQVKNIIVEGGGSIEALISKMNVKRFVIDSITSFALLYQDELERKEAALDLIDIIKNWGCTALLTSQDESSTGIFINAAMEFEVDSIILLYYVKIKGIRQRCIEILKMRGTKHESKTYALTITPGGLVVNPGKVVIF